MAKAEKKKAEKANEAKVTKDDTKGAPDLTKAQAEEVGKGEEGTEETNVGESKKGEY